jgi:hypothetical protein
MSPCHHGIVLHLLHSAGKHQKLFQKQVVQPSQELPLDQGTLFVPNSNYVQVVFQGHPAENGQAST